jgi:hypothetical protein
VHVLFESRHRRADAGHVSVVGELSANGAAEGGGVREEAGVVYPPHELMFVCELNMGEEGVCFMAR